MNDFPQSLIIDGTRLRLSVERKPVKHINARLRDDELLVSVPTRLARDEAIGIIDELARRLLRRRRGREINRDDDATALAQHVAQRFPTPPEVREVQFTTRTSACWGSYSPQTRSVRLHAALRYMPPWVLEAVVAHELAHAVHPDHSQAFWALLRAVYPETDRAQAFLAGVSWLAQAWNQLPPIERAQLAGEEEQ